MAMLGNTVQTRPFQLPLLSSILFLVITIVIFSEAYIKLNERNAALFDLRVDITKNAIEKRMVDYTQILKGAQGLINMSDTVTRREFREYVDNLDVEENYPGVQGIGYTLFLRESSRQQLEEKIRKVGVPDFRIWPPGQRKIYSSIIYLEPYDTLNVRAMGYDMYSDSVRKEAMERARDTGGAALSSAVILVQEGRATSQKGFNLYLPIYDGGESPETVEERRNNIKGYVYSPFRVKDLMNGILQSDFDDLNIQLFDGTEFTDENLLYTKSQKDASRTGLTKTVEMQHAGRSWYIIVSAAAGFGYDRNFPFFLLGGGLIITVLIFFILLSVGYVRRSTHLKQVITDNATAGLVIMNKSGVCTFMNPSAENLTGYSFAEMANKHVLELFYNKNATGNKKAKNNKLLRSFFDDELKGFELALFTKSAKKILVSINSRVIQKGSREESILLEIRNISQEKKAETELKERNRSLQTLNKIGTTLSAELELTKILQIITDSCTELTKAEFGAFFYNPAKQSDNGLPFYTLSGVEPEHFKNLSDAQVHAISTRTFTDEGVVRIEDVTKHATYREINSPNGKPSAFFKITSYMAVPVISRDASVIGSLVFFHSKTGRFNKKSEDIVKGIAAQAAIAIDNSRLFESLTNKNAELLKINNDLDNFVYTASHDLKAPVLNIEGLVYALNKAMAEDRPEKIQPMMEMIQKSILKFKETIQALTEVARTNKNVDDDFELVDLAELVEDIKLSIKEKLISTRTEIETYLPCRDIYLSKSNLRSMVFNLITNAIKYRSAQRDPKIRISCIKEEDDVILEIQDNGIGILKEHQQKIFLMFKRVHTHTEGTGIGLYLVKRIVENEGGSISVHSEVEKGTKFTITLPQKVQQYAH